MNFLFLAETKPNNSNEFIVSMFVNAIWLHIAFTHLNSIQKSKSISIRMDSVEIGVKNIVTKRKYVCIVLISAYAFTDVNQNRSKEERKK